MRARAGGGELRDHRRVEREPALGGELVREHADDGLGHRPAVQSRAGREAGRAAVHQQPAGVDDRDAARVGPGHVARAG